MKYLYKILPILLIAVLISCGGDGGDDPIPETNASTLGKLQGTWNLSSMTRDGADATSEFGGFKLIISNSNYTITNGGSAWSEVSGTIGVNGDNTATIDSMGGNTGISVAFSNNDQTITLSFTVANSTFGGGRISGLAGNYVFVLTK